MKNKLDWPRRFIQDCRLMKFSSTQLFGFLVLVTQSTMFIWLQKVSAIQSLKFHDTSKIDMKNVPFKRQKTLQSIYWKRLYNFTNTCTLNPQCALLNLRIYIQRKESNVILTGHQPLLSNYGLEPGYFEASRKDNSDTVWSIFTENIISSIPWLIMHSIGTQFFQRFKQTMIPIFHTLLSTLYLITIFDVRPVILLLAQPLAVFLVAELIPHIMSGTYSCGHSSTHPY